MTRRSINLAAAFAFLSAAMTTGCGVAYRGVETAVVSISNSELWHTGRHGALSDEEKEWAEIAWRYFLNNHNPETGFVNSTDRYPVVTMWHVADYLSALYCARRLGLIERKDFDEKFSKLLHQLNSMELFYKKLPNTLYNTQTGQMVNYANQPEALGWAVIDVGRLLLWLSIMKAETPHFSEYIDRIILRFSYCEAIDEEGVLHSAVRVNDELKTVKETGIGYTEYAQVGFRLWGLKTQPRLKVNPENKVNVLGVEFDYDSNWARRVGTYGALVTAPYVLAGMEFHWKSPGNFDADEQDGDYFRRTAEKVYEVQERRFTEKGITTARTDHQLNRPPFYLQDSIFAQGYPWSTLSDAGENYPYLALVSTRAVFGLWALWRTDYTDHLMTVVKELYDSERGWYEGRYEVSGDYERAITITTNAMVLAALAYKRDGVLFEKWQTRTFIEESLSDEFKHPNGCLPELME